MEKVLNQNLLELQLEPSNLSATRGNDRRQFGWLTMVFGFLRSRRRELRRGVDSNPTFLDWHHPVVFFLAVAIMALSIADAFFTLMLLDLGMIEANPVMNSMINQGNTWFITSKVTLTGLGLLTIVFLSRVRFLNRVRTGYVLGLIFIGYCCLITFQFTNLVHLTQ